MSKHPVWQDKQIRFDTNKNQLEQVKGEKVFWSQQYIEDAKANEGQPGTLISTNMRLIWYQQSDPKMNLSIGYSRLTSLEIKNTYTQELGNSQTLHIKARFNDSRFEFIFRSMLGDQPKIFKIFNNVHKSYENSKLFRELKMKGGDIVYKKDLLLLNGEKILSQYNEVGSVGGDQSAKGILYFTNVRIVWFSYNNENLNISIPWTYIKNIARKNIKQGPAIIIETYISPCGYQVASGLDDIVQEAQKLMKFYNENPNYGVTSDEEPQSNETAQIPSFKDEEIEFVESEFNDKSNAARSYATDTVDQQNNDNKIIYAPEFGLAVEQPQDGCTLEDLWKIIKINK